MHDSKDGWKALVESSPTLTGKATPPGHDPTPIDADPLLGRTLDERFTLRQLLGRGGMGCVYRALQLSMDREVAVKVLAPEMASSEESVQRFLNEARIASRLRHPNTVMVLDFGQTSDGLLYLAMELLQGRALGDILKSEGALSAERVARIVCQMCDSLEEAHAVGLAHRDLKPDNVFILEGSGHRDTVKVLDFGIARLDEGRDTRLTAPGTVLGTPIYMSPEQVRGQTADARSDIYSLGVMMFELLTGAAPYERGSAVEVMVMHLTAPVPDVASALPDAPAELALLVQSMLSKDPAERPDSVREVREALEALSFDGRRAGTTPPPSRSAPHLTQTVQPGAPAAPPDTARGVLGPPRADTTSAGGAEPQRGAASVTAAETAAPPTARRKGPLLAAAAVLALALGGTAAFLTLPGAGEAPEGAPSQPPPAAQQPTPAPIVADPSAQEAPAAKSPNAVPPPTAAPLPSAAPEAAVEAAQPHPPEATAEAAPAEATTPQPETNGGAPEPASEAAATPEPAGATEPAPGKADVAAPAPTNDGATAAAKASRKGKPSGTKPPRGERADRPKGDLADKYGLK